MLFYASLARTLAEMRKDVARTGRGVGRFLARPLVGLLVILGYLGIQLALLFFYGYVGFFGGLALITIGGLSQYYLYETRRRHGRESHDHLIQVLELENEKQQLFVAAADYKEKCQERGQHINMLQQEVSGARAQLAAAQRRYDSLMNARTQDIIDEVHARLSRPEPPRIVFPAVPAAPDVPKELMELPKPEPPF